MALDKKRSVKYAALFILGMLCVILGIALVLVWWKDVVSICRGVAGIFVALGGLLILYIAQQ